MESWIRKQHFGSLPVDFEELEFVLGDLLQEVLDVEDIDLKKPVELTFTIKFDETGGVRIESIGNKFVSRSRELAMQQNLFSVVEQQNTLVLTAELAEVKKNEFGLAAYERKVVVLSKDGQRQLREFALSLPIEEKIVDYTFKNGILEVVLKKKPA